MNAHPQTVPVVKGSISSPGQDLGRRLLMSPPIPSRIKHSSPGLTNLKSFSPDLLLLIPLFTPNNLSRLMLQAAAWPSGKAGFTLSLRVPAQLT